jgi:endonuclease YncB( thermonuclease family)
MELSVTVALFIAAAVIPAGQSFQCTPIRVWDGDGPIWCAEGPHVRLSGVAAREMDGSCSVGHPCPSADPINARDALVSLIGRPVGQSREGHILVRGPKMTCVSDGGAGGSRTAAFCISPQSGDISCAVVRSGWAAKWNKYWRGHKCRGEFPT